MSKEIPKEIPLKVYQGLSNIRQHLESGHPDQALLAILKLLGESNPETEEEKPISLGTEGYHQELFLDPKSGEILAGNESLCRLSRSQTELFLALVRSPNKIITYEEIYEIAYAEELPMRMLNGSLYPSEFKRIYRRINLIRKKLEMVSVDFAERLENRRGFGYRWKNPKTPPYFDNTNHKG